MKMTINFRFEISPKDILIDGRMAGKPTKPHEFKFPVAISSSLRLVFIMGTVIQVFSQSEFVCQFLFHPRCPFSPEYQGLLQQLNKPRYQLGMEDEDSADKHAVDDIPHEACHEWIRCWFSPCERYMTALRGEGPPGPSRIFSSWVLDIYEKPELKPVSDFRLIASSGLRLNSTASHHLCFHPNKPAVAICMMSITAIWRFKQNGELR
jgi:hypothetical protein